jgi:hypothetical protein
MKVFLTGSQGLDWRWNIGGFLREQQIDFFDSAEYPREFLSLFKYFKILEGCDGLIACFSKWEPQHLQTVLEISYASKLGKEILVVDHAYRRKSWVHTLPYSMNFPNLDGLKEHLVKTISSPQKQPRLLG